VCVCVRERANVKKTDFEWERAKESVCEEERNV
jgi:hypothetical protein